MQQQGAVAGNLEPFTCALRACIRRSPKKRRRTVGAGCSSSVLRLGAWGLSGSEQVRRRLVTSTCFAAAARRIPLAACRETNEARSGAGWRRVEERKRSINLLAPRQPHASTPRGACTGKALRVCVCVCVCVCVFVCVCARTASHLWRIVRLLWHVRRVLVGMGPVAHCRRAAHGRVVADFGALPLRRTGAALWIVPPGRGRVRLDQLWRHSRRLRAGGLSRGARRTLHSE